MWVVGTPTRLTCVTAGVYAISGHLQWATVATGVRGIGIYLNGATFVATDSEAGSAASNWQSIATIFPLVVGDYLQLMGYQSSGAALNHTAAGDYGGECAAALLS